MVYDYKVSIKKKSYTEIFVYETQRTERTFQFSTLLSKQGQAIYSKLNQTTYGT